MNRTFRAALGALPSLGLAAAPALADRAYLDQFREAADHAFGAGRDQAPIVLARYGTPDVDDSTAYDNPRPPIVIRSMDYRKAGVRVLLAARESLRKPPPYTWALIGFVDIASDQAIPFDEGDRRLRAAN
jgi:hypothetical protein